MTVGYETKGLDLYQQDTRRVVPKDLSERDCLINFTMGLTGEAIEVSGILRSTHLYLEKVISELGDVNWYLARLADHFQISFESLHTVAKAELPSQTTRSDDAHGLVIAAGAVQEYFKKILYQKHPLDKAKLHRLLTTVLSCLLALAMWFNTTIYEVAEQNTAKLLRRYPSGFSVEASLNRES